VAWARPAAATCEAARSEEPQRAFLLTTYRGEGAETASGHSALWISGGGLPNGVVFNWGAYDGSQPTWWWHFVKGDLDFWAADEPISKVYKRSKARNRKILAQRLDVPSGDLARLTRELAHLSLPENRHYRYDWFTASCATKTRDAIDRLLGGALQAATQGEAENTRRDDMLRHMDIYYPAWFGLNFLLSGYHDRPISRWDAMFDPEHLVEEVAALQVQRSGGLGPLVSETCTLRESDWPATPAKPPDRRLALWAAGAGVGGLLYGLGRAGQRVAALRWVVGGLVAAWGLLAGGLGLAVLVIWLSTTLPGLGPTEAWFQASPLTFGLVPAGLAFARHGVAAPAWAGRIARALLGLGLLGLALDPLPFFEQENFDLIGLLLLPLVGIAALFGPWGRAAAAATAVAGEAPAR
jgi:hypothetical protein